MATVRQAALRQLFERRGRRFSSSECAPRGLFSRVVLRVRSKAEERRNWRKTEGN
jgi:hypothetical protein